MAQRDWETLLAIGERLTSAQAREQQAAEAYRRSQDRFSREIWMQAVQTVEKITTDYLVASTACVEAEV
jgi:hypothetical protein